MEEARGSEWMPPTVSENLGLPHIVRQPPSDLRVKEGHCAVLKVLAKVKVLSFGSFLQILITGKRHSSLPVVQRFRKVDNGYCHSQGPSNRERWQTPQGYLPLQDLKHRYSEEQFLEWRQTHMHCMPAGNCLSSACRLHVMVPRKQQREGHRASHMREMDRS